MKFRSKRKPDYQNISRLEDELGLDDDNSVDLSTDLPTSVQPEIGGEPIVAWRAWSATREDRSREILEEILRRREIPEGLGPVVVSRLAALAVPTVWPTHRLDAECNHTGHIAPQKDCTCGVWAMKNEFDVPGGEVWGQVYLWGRILEFGKGYRAQFAYPKCLYFNEHSEANRQIVSELALLYDVPCEPRERKGMYLSAIGSGNLTIASAFTSFRWHQP